MSFIQRIAAILPDVKGPTQRKLSFKQKLKWTFVILVMFYFLGIVPLYGLNPNSQFQFEQLGLILGAKFGTIISLGIGPIVTASIVLQLLAGSGIIKMDTNSPEGRKRFQATQKVLSLFFIVFEAIIYVMLGGLSPIPTLAGSEFFTMQIVLILQLILGGFIIMLMDEVVQKWGFGSGISLFIVAGVAQSIFVQTFSPLDSSGHLFFSTGQPPIGQLLAFFVHVSQNQGTQAIIALSAILATIFVFVLSVYTQAMKVEIPLSFGRVRGYGIRWPLKFIYTSNIPVILIAALFANFQLWAQLMENWAASTGGPIVNFFSTHILGQVATPAAGGGLLPWISPDPRGLIQPLITGTFDVSILMHSAGYMVLMMLGAVLFSWFWVVTSGQDAESQAKKILSSGLQIPGFRRDPRILERILARYIGPLTVMGGLTVGFLAAGADLTGALSRGTGILLAVMIIYQMYEQIAKEHMMEMNPAMRKFME